MNCLTEGGKGMMRNYEKVEAVLSIIGAVVSGGTTVLYLSNNNTGIGKMVLFVILIALFGASVVFVSMDKIKSTTEAVGIGILLVLIMPIISIVMTYCLLVVWTISAFVIKIFSIFGWATFGIVAAILIGLFFYVLHELIG